MTDYQVLLEALAVVSAALYILLAAQIIKMRRLRVSGVSDIREVFALLSQALREDVPGLPVGFTWGEGIERARELGISLNWDSVHRALRSYQDYRYGGNRREQADYGEVIRLVNALRGSL